MKIAALIAFGLALLAGSAAAQTTSYTFRGGPFTAITNSTTCTVGECGTYTGAHRATATLTFAAPLAPNLPTADRSADVTAFTFSDGVRTTTGPGALGSMQAVLFGTDAAGLPINFLVVLERTPGPPYAVGDPTDPNSRLSIVALAPNQSQGVTNAECSTRAPTAAGSSPGNCSIAATDSGSSTAIAMTPTIVTLGVPVAVPTMTEWAMILLALLLAGSAVLIVSRRRPEACA
ncbi:IPTL-CTERM sorting domain-containing protein [Brevundimonas staleyi]|uniref:IPTL-CTERM sorting domain-containing protein n=1 Tax=Brevundimonas staleyi TaxID=74326 RepID=A0ABW0FXP5_9CAUL